MASAPLTIRETPADAVATGQYTARGALQVLFQLLLLILVVRGFELEKSRGLTEVLAIVAAGLIPFMLLPLRWRMPWFLLLSLVVCVQVAGGLNTAWIWGIGGVLLGICHLPASTKIRAVALVAAGAAIAYFRLIGESPFWPILGSMFMFRLFIYFQEQPTEARPTSWAMRLSYFFMLPNACFPFYPIIDYRTFCESWFKQPADETAQQGVDWIARGLVQLLLYRAVKYFLLPSPEEIATIGDVTLFLATNYLLYLRISGAFHLITGMLHLFGFALPRTHDKYFLASSFTDFWRRINIYWKNFVERFFFKPAFYRLRRFGLPTALTASIVLVFAATCVLHSYQVFWLVGEFPISLNEIGLWLLGGALVAGSAYFEWKRAKAAKGKPDAAPLWQATRHALKVIGVFFTVSVFWASWTVPGFVGYLGTLASASAGFYQDSWQVAVALIVTVAIGVVVQLIWRRWQDAPASADVTPWLDRCRPVGNVFAAGLLLLATSPTVSGHLGLPWQTKLDQLQQELATAAEASRDMPGYYEQLADVNSQSAPLVGRQPQRTKRNAKVFTELTRDRANLIEVELIPGWEGTLAEATITINDHGMRSPSVTLAKPDGTYRIAVIGSSVTMGYGVNDDETFCRLLETELNAALPDSAPNVEVLNFACGQYYSLHMAGVLREKIFDFAPDAVFFIGHQGELQGPPRHVNRLRDERLSLPYPGLDQVVRDVGVTDKLSSGTAQAVLSQHGDALTTAIYQGIVADCQARDVTPVWIYLPIPGILEKTETDDAIVSAVKQSGIHTIDLRHWAEDADPAAIKLGQYDHHLNAAGHILAAAAIGAAIRQDRDATSLPFPED